MMTNRSALAAGVALSGCLALWAGAAQAQETSHPTVEIGGRAFLDYVRQDVDREAGLDFDAHDSRVRTARIHVQGDLAPRFSYKAEIDVGGGETQWQDLYIAYDVNDATTVTLGNIKTLSLENLTSARFTTFMERGAFNDMLGLGRLTALQVKTGGDNWTLAGALTGDNINDADDAQVQTGVSLRGTFAPVNTDRTKVHLGAWVRNREQDATARLNYRVRNNTNFGGRYVSTGSIGEGDTTFALEGAWVHGPFSVQGEWASVDVDRFGGGSADLRTWYAFASWFPTGEMRRYRPEQGRFDRPKILRPVSDGGAGAVELAVRYDNADLTDVGAGGEYSAWTVGATWHPISHARFMANYTVSDNDNRALGADVEVKTLQFRAQFDF